MSKPKPETLQQAFWKLRTVCATHKLGIRWDKPLAIGIRQVLCEALPTDAISKRKIRQGLAHITHTDVYQRKLMICGHRYGLHGKQIEPVSIKHKQQAAKVLAKLKEMQGQKPIPVRVKKRKVV